MNQLRPYGCATIRLRASLVSLSLLCNLATPLWFAAAPSNSVHEDVLTADRTASGQMLCASNVQGSARILAQVLRPSHDPYQLVNSLDHRVTAVESRPQAPETVVVADAIDRWLRRLRTHIAATDNLPA